MPQGGMAVRPISALDVSDAIVTGAGFTHPSCKSSATLCPRPLTTRRSFSAHTPHLTAPTGCSSRWPVMARRFRVVGCLVGEVVGNALIVNRVMVVSPGFGVLLAVMSQLLLAKKLSSNWGWAA